MGLCACSSLPVGTTPTTGRQGKAVLARVCRVCRVRSLQQHIRSLASSKSETRNGFSPSSCTTWSWSRALQAQHTHGFCSCSCSLLLLLSCVSPFVACRACIAATPRRCSAASHTRATVLPRAPRNSPHCRSRRSAVVCCRYCVGAAIDIAIALVASKRTKDQGGARTKRARARASSRSDRAVVSTVSSVP